MKTKGKMAATMMAAMLGLMSPTNAQNLGISATGVAPHPSAGLDVNFTDRGVLIPRIALTSTTSAGPISNPANSLLVYNTTNNPSAGLTPGYYYNAGTTTSPIWVRLLNSGSPSDAWLTRGNAGTNPATHFIGTTDNVALVFRTNNTEKMRITASGNVGIGTTLPSEKLEILGGGIQLNDTMGIGFNEEIPYKSNVTPGPAGDRARIYYDWNFFGIGGDALVIEKTDGNHVNPDGGIAFTNKGSNNIRNIAMTIRGSGDVGIGTTNPLGKLHVNNDVVGSDSSFVVRQNGNVGIGTTNPLGKLHVNNDVVGSDSSFVVRQNGNVGIGTAAPGQKLEVVGNIGLSNGTSNAILFNSAGVAPPSVGSTGSKIVLYSGSGLPTNNPRYALGIQPGAIWYSSGGNHIWYTESSGTWTERMRLTSGGNVGIGTTNPLGKLHVNNDVVGSDSSFVVKLSGNVGIGTTAPTSKLGVVGNLAVGSTYGTLAAPTGGAIIQGDVGIGTTAPISALNIRGFSGGTGGDPLAGYTRNVVIGGPYNQAYNSGNATLLEIRDYSNDGGDNVYPIYVCDENSYVDFFLRAGTTNSNSNALAYFGARVGIGTMAPTSRLGVVGNLAVGGTYGSLAAPTGGAIIEGNVGIGTTTPNERLSVVGNICATGNINGNSATCGSDIRWKKDLKPLENTLEKISQLKPVYYYWKKDEFPDKHFTDKRQIGLIAQDMQKVFPELVVEDKEGYLSVDYSRFTSVLLKAIQEQQQQIQDQQKIIQKQQEEISALNEKLNIVINTLSAEKKVGNK